LCARANEIISVPLEEIGAGKRVEDQLSGCDSDACTVNGVIHRYDITRVH